MLALLLVIPFLSFNSETYAYTTSTTVPSEYASYVAALKTLFPNATFQFDYIDQDFSAAVSSQVGRKKVQQLSSDSWKALLSSNYSWDTGTWTYTEGGWTYASYETVAYYMDPRNFLNEKYIFTFLEQGTDGSETLEGVQSILSGTFMYDYAEYVLEAAEQSGVNAYVLASIMRNEQGTTVTSLTSGTYAGYELYYNFFNVRATGSTTTDVIVNGLTYAQSQGWDTVEKSIIGGAVFYGKNYVAIGQDTYYYMHYNVALGNLSHQYATAVWAATSSGSTLGTRSLSYLKDLAITFTIPVYNNMPSAASELPTRSSGLNNYYFSAMSVSGGTLSLSFDMYTNSYTLSVSGNTTLYYSVPDGASYTGSSSYSLSAGTNTVALTVKSQTGYTRTYTITVTASSACTLKVSSGTAEDDTSLTGDANGDGKVTASDYVIIKRHIIGSYTITDTTLFNNADANGDGKITASDYVLVKRIIINS